MRAPGRSKVRQQDTPDHLRPEDKKMSRDSVVGLCSPGQPVEGCISPVSGWASQGPLYPSRGPLFRDPLPCPPSQPGAGAPSGWAPFYISSASSRGGKFGNKSQLMLWTVPRFPPVLLVIPSLGREPGAWRGLGSKRVSQLCPCPTPCSISCHSTSLN